MQKTSKRTQQRQNVYSLKKELMATLLELAEVYLLIENPSQDIRIQISKILDRIEELTKEQE